MTDTIFSHLYNFTTTSICWGLTTITVRLPKPPSFLSRVAQLGTAAFCLSAFVCLSLRHTLAMYPNDWTNHQTITPPYRLSFHQPI